MLCKGNSTKNRVIWRKMGDFSSNSMNHGEKVVIFLPFWALVH